MKVPKTMKRHCRKCKKHTSHKVAQTKKRTPSSLKKGSKYRAMKRGQAFSITTLVFFGLLAMGFILLIVYITFYTDAGTAAAKWAAMQMGNFIKSITQYVASALGSLGGSIVPTVT